MKSILLLGSTGSVGRNTLAVIAHYTRAFQVAGLCAYADSETLLQQIKIFRPRSVCVVHEAAAAVVRARIKKDIRFFSGKTGLSEFASQQADISVMAISGICALTPLMQCLRYSKTVALANKEAIVTAGDFVFARARQYRTRIIPVDSEINAFFQLLERCNQPVKKMILTASGGALLDYTKKQLAGITAQQVLRHPTWSMGKRITIDSATLVNKAFEAIETHKFFNIPYNAIEIVIHRESTIHAMIEMQDNTRFACLYPPDMRVPLAYALHYPQRVPSHLSTPHTGSAATLTYAPVRAKQFPLLQFILETAQKPASALVVANACDETAIEYFLQGKIRFIDIGHILRTVAGKHRACALRNLDDIWHWDAWARTRTKKIVEDA